MKACKNLNTFIAFLVASRCHGMNYLSNSGRELHDLDAYRPLPPDEGAEHHGQSDVSYWTTWLSNNHGGNAKAFEACFDADWNPFEPFSSEITNSMNKGNSRATSSQPHSGKTSVSTDSFKSDFDTKFDSEHLTSNRQSQSDIEEGVLASFKAIGRSPPPLTLEEDELLIIANHYACSKGQSLSNTEKKQDSIANIRREKLLVTRKKIIREKVQALKSKQSNWHQGHSEVGKLDLMNYWQLAEKGQHRHAGIVFPIFLFYVEMINEVVPQVNSEGQVINQSSKLKTACDLFWQLALSLHQNPELITNALLKEKVVAIRKRAFRRTSQEGAHAVVMASLWNFLEFWMINERPTLMSQIKLTKYPNEIQLPVKTFLSTLFVVLN